MTYPQSFYADLFDNYLSTIEKDGGTVPKRSQIIQAISSKVQRDDAVLANQFISAIRQPYQDILRKYYKEDVSCTQMAAEYGITASGVTYQKRRALRVIRDLIRENPSLSF